MIDTDSALKMLGDNTNTTESNVDTASQPADTSDKGVITAEAPTETVEAHDMGSEADREPAEEMSDVNTPQKSQSKRHDKQAKIDYAFQREKAKRKQMQEEYDKKIADLEAKLKRFEHLEKSDFANDADYINHIVTRHDEMRDLSDLRKQKQAADYESQLAEAQERHAVRIDKCFDNDADKDAYIKLLSSGAQTLSEQLQDADPDGIVNSYLDDSDVSPLMVTRLIKHPDELDNILAKRNPMNRIFALKALENKCIIGMKLRGSKDSTAKPRLPILGSQIRTAANTAVSDISLDEYLRKYPSANSYHTK